MQYEDLLKQLSGRGFLPQVVATAEEARDEVLRIIGSKSVGIGGSATVRDMKLYELLTAQGNEVHCHWPVPAEQKTAERNAAVQADVYLSSTNALISDGRLFNIDGAANRVAGLIYGPETVIVIAGKNKIVGSLDEAYERTRRDCCPGNARRQGFKTPCALVGECNDCRSADRMCRVVTIHEMPTRRVKAFHILIVDQDLGL